jgi:hypothetical protein
MIQDQIDLANDVSDAIAKPLCPEQEPNEEDLLSGIFLMITVIPPHLSFSQKQSWMTWL